MVMVVRIGVEEEERMEVTIGASSSGQADGRGDGMQGGIGVVVVVGCMIGRIGDVK